MAEMNHPNITRFLKLPFTFDTQRLEDDLSKLTDQNWVPHFNTRDYEGEWKVISLYSASGSETDILALNPDEAKMIETPALNRCGYFKEVIDQFKTAILSARILRLAAGAIIKPHRDHKLGYEDGNFRIHIPITTNPDVSFILDNTPLLMKPGECWYTNVNFTHSVANRGTSDRVHLVIDAQRNSWTDELFFALAPKNSFRQEMPREESPETLKRMIEELSLSDAPVAKNLIAELKEKLKRFRTK